MNSIHHKTTISSAGYKLSQVQLIPRDIFAEYCFHIVSQRRFHFFFPYGSFFRLVEFFFFEF